MVFTSRGEKEPIEVRHLEADDITEATVQMKTVPFREIGPSFDLLLRREKLASHDLFKEACRQPNKKSYEKKRADKNKFTNVLGEQKGKVFLQHQPLETIALRKFKGMGKPSKAGDAKPQEAKLTAEDV